MHRANTFLRMIMEIKARRNDLEIQSHKDWNVLKSAEIIIEIAELEDTLENLRAHFNNLIQV